MNISLRGQKENASNYKDALVTHLSRVEAASTLIPRCSGSWPSRLCGATWRASRSCPIRLFIHPEVVQGGSEQKVNTQQIFSS